MQFKPKPASVPFLLATGAGVAIGVATNSLAVSTAVGSGIGLLLSLVYRRMSGNKTDSSAKCEKNVFEGDHSPPWHAP
jgi:hypothetical protein